ncbi:hypothetical protein M8C21_000341 [Ambrosia artemisiifolia]|uniref:Uncharacterized protein n=1 Tax=Ambrosia artemisiifolia TaxID=4212 RepID=A0AAD5GMS4_AMBAR|nr:hypothetical protein M8C21_000341 [Ambrosia artemisiifolia]
MKTKIEHWRYKLKNITMDFDIFGCLAMKLKLFLLPFWYVIHHEGAKFQMEFKSSIGLQHQDLGSQLENLKCYSS